MKYIYQIIIGNKCYIGQSAASGDNPYARVCFHLNCAYGNAKGDASEPVLLDEIRNHNLQDIKINIFTEPNYGFSENMYKIFFENLRPYGSRISNKKLTATSGIIASTEDGFEYSDLMKLDAAEILHIANAQNTYKVLNAEMGGQYYGWSLSGTPDDLILQKQFEPSEALRVLNYIDSKYSNLQNEIDQFFSEWLKSAKGNTYWKELEKLINYNSKAASKKTWNDFIYEKVQQWFWDPRTQKGVWSSFSYELAKKLKIDIPNLELKFRKPTDVNETLATTISQSFAFQISRAIKSKQFKDISEAISAVFDKKTFAGGHELTLSFSQLIDLEKSGLTIANWWKYTPTVSLTQDNTEFKNRIKLIAYNTFKNIYRTVAIENIYLPSGRTVEVGERKFIYSEPTSPSLSAKIHEGYRQRNITANFVTNNWRKFYGPMVSYHINSYAGGQWALEQLEDSMKEIAFRENKTLIYETEDGSEKLPIAHTVKNGHEEDWLTSDLSQITIY